MFGVARSGDFSTAEIHAMKTSSITAPIALLASCLISASVAAQAPQPVQVAELDTLTATVESLDRKARLVELRSGDQRRTLHVPTEMRNFDQLNVGDEIVVQYYEGLGAKFKKKGESTTAGLIDVNKETQRAPQGALPEGLAATTVTTTVVIESVDRPSNSVTFTGPAGMTRTIEVRDPNAKQFISTLKEGDEVELTYTEALAVTVEPKKAR
jgi:hypothetical protein